MYCGVLTPRTTTPQREGEDGTHPPSPDEFHNQPKRSYGIIFFTSRGKRAQRNSLQEGILRQQNLCPVKPKSGGYRLREGEGRIWAEVGRSLWKAGGICFLAWMAVTHVSFVIIC